MWSWGRWYFARRVERWRRVRRARWELMVSASAVKGLVGSLGYSAASVLFAGAFGVLVDGVLMEIESAAESETGGLPYV